MACTLCFHPEFRFKYLRSVQPFPCSLLPGCVSETQSSGRFPLPAHVSVMESECLLLSAVPL